MLKIATAALFLLAGGASAFAQAPAPEAPPKEAMKEAEVSPLPISTDCTFTKVFVCDKDKGCNPAKELGEIDLPAHFLVHFGERVLVSVDDNGVPHLSTIYSVSGAGPQLTLQGTDGLVGWIMQMSRADNDATLTTVVDDTIVTAFGTCKPSH
ncbi:hypothetical protein MKI84_13640 [Ancylobacter sp. A5.8]|uniref:hypothetical protein n=1 Tax=Ancylobacter gelatini TaxID=2919920 RepID=UPI001F4E683C|nr:hypothetical protein [Ancylobacter gelatini]MCJ8143962.1 hypothetical protein [Ancylobacter gelatini]